MTETNGTKAYELAERILNNIMKLKIIEINNTAVTASFGISIFDPSNQDIGLINQADIALYDAKNSARN